jgi:hypothetical protein
LRPAPAIVATATTRELLAVVVWILSLLMLLTLLRRLLFLIAVRLAIPVAVPEPAESPATLTTALPFISAFIVAGSAAGIASGFPLTSGVRIAAGIARSRRLRWNQRDLGRSVGMRPLLRGRRCRRSRGDGLEVRIRIRRPIG